MQYLLLGVILATVGAQTILDPTVVEDIFGKPPTPGPTAPPPPATTTQAFEDITVRPTEGTTTLLNKDGQSCQCVPYYLCDSNNVGVDINNPSITGYGELDIRFGEEDCTESVEICCTLPKDPNTPKPRPDPAKVKGCGYRNPQGVGVTFTGAGPLTAQFGEFPWVVALLDTRNTSYAGVGVLIHPQVVMTGAHIAYKYTPETLKIRAGEWDTQTNKEIYDAEERNVAEIYIHKDFQPKSLKNDMALLRLESPLTLAEHINVVCMPEQGEVFDGHKNCVANGWGKDNFGLTGRYAVILKKVEQDMVPHGRCNSLLKRTRLGNYFKLHSSFVCAGGEEGRDTCKGDGGAPLVCPIGNNRYKLSGLVSWGIGCGEKDVPGVYANVPAFRTWVDEKMATWGLEATSYRLADDK